MLPRTALFIFLLVVTKNIYGQSKDSVPKFYKQSLYVEFVGNTYGLIGVYYERIINVPKNDFYHFTIRAGFGFGNRNDDSSKAGFTNIPVECNFFLGKNHAFETGIGWTPSFGHDFIDNKVSPPIHYRNYGCVYFFRLGYRYTGKDRWNDGSGLLIRAAPLIQLENNPKWRLSYSFGLSLGGSFNSFRDIFSF
jgi:hypothetical protein